MVVEEALNTKWGRLFANYGDVPAMTKPLYEPKTAATAGLLGIAASALALWWLDIDSELVFVGDAGTTEAGRPSRRYGIEWANYYTPTDWLTFDADFSF